MKKLHLLLILSVFGLSCENGTKIPPDLKPTYSDFKSDWQERNLYGKVKKLEKYKTIYQNSEIKDKPVLILRIKFAEFGAIKKREHFNEYGELIQKDIYFYDKNENVIKWISNNIPDQIKLVETIKTDSLKKIKKNVVRVNDTVYYKATSFLDSLDLPSKQIVIEDNDTIVTTLNYTFDDNGNILLRTRSKKGNNEPIAVSHYKYDYNDNLIKFSHKTEWSENITKTEWENDRIVKQKEYTITADLEKHLQQITKYGKLFNPLKIKFYENSELTREMKYNYEFDDNGNWIKKKVSLKEHFANSDKFIPIYIITRKIKYYD